MAGRSLPVIFQLMCKFTYKSIQKQQQSRELDQLIIVGQYRFQNGFPLLTARETLKQSEEEKMYKSSPAWSMPSKSPSHQSETRPAPGTYDPVVTNHSSTPAWRIGSAERSDLVVSDAPGAGTYTVSTSPKSVKFGTIGKENRDLGLLAAAKCPSPADYYPKLLGSCSSVVFGGKNPPLKSPDIPGPGAYSGRQLTKVSGVKFNRQNRFRDNKEAACTPGPASYQAEPKLSTAVVSFTREKRECDSKLKACVIPGPGSYVSQSQFEDGLRYKKGYSLATKPTQRQLSFNPGPGAYNPNIVAVVEKNPCFSISGKVNLSKSVITPAPNSYNPAQFRTTTEFSIGRAKRSTIDCEQNIPGPGSYLFHSRPSSPKYSLGLGRKDEQKQDIPGPGMYSPNKNYVKRRPQSAKIGTSQRQDMVRGFAPGPGTYLDSYKMTVTEAPKVSFTREKKQISSNGSTPGPAAYNIPSAVAQVAPYYKK